MVRFFGIILAMMAALVVLAYALAHFGIVILLALGGGVVGRHLRRHSSWKDGG